MADEDLSLPDDVFVPILLHLPTSSRRRFRLVCKRWRDVIDERTPEMLVGTKILAFVSQHNRGSRAIVFDKEDGCRRHAWIFPCSHERSTTAVSMVGTCNGLLCLHERVVAPGNRSFSIVTVVNPITGDTLELPPPPESSEPEQERAQAGKYSFGYHPTTGKYKVVRIPCGRRRQGAVHAVQVFTLGGGGDTASWREVPVTAPGGGASCSPLSEAISVDGRTYWLDASGIRVMALDLEDERVTSFAAPPPPACPGLLPAAGAGWELTSVRGRLGAVATTAVGRVDVWVLDDGGGGGGARPRWSRRYEIVEATPRTSDYWIVAPELTHGEYILRSSRDRMTRDDYRIWGYTCGRRRLYRHKVGDLTSGGDGEDDGQSPPVVEGWELLMSAEESHGDLTTFAYVETLEPLPLPLPSTHG